MFVFLVLFGLVGVLSYPYNATSYEPSTFQPFLFANRLHQCDGRPDQPPLPRSYWAPASYFDNLPVNERIPPVHQNKKEMHVPLCGKTVLPEALDAYEFDTERFLSALGLNIYDGSLWGMALSILGFSDEAIKLETAILKGAATCQFGDIRGDAVCKGVLVKGTCVDPDNTGSCGFCYGDASSSLPKENAWTFRMISDYWALEGTVDKRCPELGYQWTWNDYRPILGENSWGNLMGPLQVAFFKYKSVSAIPQGDVSLQIALAFLESLPKMVSPIGAVYYSPKNTLGYSNKDLGFDVSTENNISLLGGLKMLESILSKNGYYLEKLADIHKLIESIQSYIKSSYDPSLGYFRQGGSFDPASGTFKWAEGSAIFAVDCQTWAMSIINPLLIDQWFGSQTSKNIWETTKRLGGYECKQENQKYLCNGVGFTNNVQDQVFSGEWTFGAINMLRIFAKEYNDPNYLTEASKMRDAIAQQLTQTQNIDGQDVVGVLYSNRRYWIPFGWWANPLLSTVSTAWAVLVDSDYNPLHLGGEYIVNY